MLPLRARLRPTHLVAICLVLLLSAAVSSRVAAAEKEICNLNADFLLGLEDYPTAIVLHQKLLRVHPDDALAHYHLGFAYGMIGRTTDEISEYLTAERLGLAKWDLFLNLGLAYLEENESLKATEALHNAVSLGPFHPETHFDLAIAYEKANKLREALQEIITSIRLAPENPDERNMKAIICTELADFACARDEWARLVQVAPEYTPARINLSILEAVQMPSAASTSRTLKPDEFAARR